MFIKSYVKPHSKRANRKNITEKSVHIIITVAANFL